MKKVTLTQHMDYTVTVRVGEDLYLRRGTPRSEQELSPNPFYWGNWTKATGELLCWVNSERDRKQKEFERDHKKKELCLYKDGKLLVTCRTDKYLSAFVEEHYPNDDCIWVHTNGNYIEYGEYIRNRL